jgi:hypothetical protein
MDFLLMDGKEKNMTLRPSRILLGWFVVIHLSAMVVSVTSVKSSLILTLLILLIALSFAGYVLKDYCMSFPCSLYSLTKHGDGLWALNYKDEHPLDDLRLTSSYASNYFMILYFQGKRFRTHNVLIPFDAVAPETYRQLRIYCLDPNSYPR